MEEGKAVAKGQDKVGEGGRQIVQSISLECADEHAAVEFVEKLPRGKVKVHTCARCTSDDANMMLGPNSPAKRNAGCRWRCRPSNQCHTVRTGTVMEESRIPMRVWCNAFWWIL